MKRRKFRVQVSLVMALVCCVSLMGCAWDKQAKSCPYQEFIVVDVLDLFANYYSISLILIYYKGCF